MKKLVLITAMIMASTAAQAIELKTNAPACQSKEMLERLVMAKGEGDEVAFKKLLLVASASGNCIALHKGDTVFVQDVSWSGYAKVRQEGEVVEYWTLADAVQ